MSPSGPYSTSRNEWALDVDLDDEAVKAKVTTIPGLRLDTINSRVLGHVDAVAAACLRMKVERPVLPSPEQMLMEFAQLRTYQQRGVERVHHLLKKYGGALNADDMGLGKTRQALVTGYMLKASKVCIICPAASRETWREEIQKLGNKDASLAVLSPVTNKKTKAEWERASTTRFVVSSIELAEKALSTVFATQSPDLLIIDEAHRFKKRKGAMRSRLNELAALTPFKLALTGTPMDRPRDLWSLMDLLVPGRFGSAYDYDLAYSGGFHGEHGFVNKGSSNPEELALRLSYYMVRREKSEVLKELPPLQRQVLWLDPDAGGREAFARAISGGLSWAKALEATLEAKIPEAVALACQAKRFLLVTERRDHAERLCQLIREEGVPCQYIHGEVAEQERKRRIKHCEVNGEGLVVTRATGGTGLNLQGIASTGIMHALSHVGNDLLQAEDRLNRLGQTEPVLWYYLACRGTMDALVLNGLLPKMDVQRAVMPGQGAMTGLRKSLGALDEGASRKAIYEALGNSQEEDSTWMQME